jgi:peptidyl-prolyl cis-trans isomerase SurA
VSRSRVAAFAVALAVAVGPVLAGCGTNQAGAAAIVGDQRISVSELQTATTELKRLVQDPSQITQELVLGWLIANPAAVQVATQKGQAVSRDDALRFFSQANFRNGSGGTTPSDAAVTAVQTAYTLQILAGQDVDQATAKANVDQVIADLKAEKVTVNPRYGTFDYAWDAQTQSFTLSPSKVNWIATPSATPTPQPSAS